MTIAEEKDKLVYPSVIFKVKDNLFSLNSQHVETILQLPDYELLPDAPPYITGIFTYRGNMVEIFNLRLAFGMLTINDEFKKFDQMLEDRKQDHIRWVKELERTAISKEKFTLATDPHKCAFGKWYDSFQCNNHEVMFHLKKIDEPHKKLHRAALEVENCNHDCEYCTRLECVNTILKRIKEESMPKIIQLLDETKTVFEKTYFREMVLILSGETKIGVLVDEVLSVEKLLPASNQDGFNNMFSLPYLTGVMKSEKQHGLILEVDGTEILNALKS